MSDDFVSSPFDAIRHYDKNGNEYWIARELHKLLGYSTWQRFQGVIEQAKTYFAVQTRRQELADERETLENEEGKRIKYRGKMRFLDNELNDEAHKAGARNPRDYSDFFDSGYRGLYSGETENDIHARKGLQPKDNILNHMESKELDANLFRTPPPH